MSADPSRNGTPAMLEVVKALRAELESLRAELAKLKSHADAMADGIDNMGARAWVKATMARTNYRKDYPKP